MMVLQLEVFLKNEFRFNNSKNKENEQAKISLAFTKKLK